MSDVHLTFSSVSVNIILTPCTDAGHVILTPCTDAAMCGGCKHCKLVIGRGELGLEPAAKLVLSLSGFIIITTLIHWIPRSPHKWHVLDPARKQSFQGFN